MSELNDPTKRFLCYDAPMSFAPMPARIHLLPAKAAPVVVIVRRKPSKLFHIIRWNTKTDQLEHGSWFHGKLYPKRCDVSFDGNWFVYLAMGSAGNIWNGISRLPYLKTVAEATVNSTWFGGGYWHSKLSLLLNNWTPDKGKPPFRLDQLKAQFGGEDLSVFYPRLMRDGWKRRGDEFGEDWPLVAPTHMVKRVGDDGWRHQPSRKHPSLNTQYIGYLQHGYTFRFWLDEYPDLLDEAVDSACWDSLGNLIFSRRGIVTKYGLAGLKRGEPTAVFDLESLTKPPAGQ